MSREIKFRVWQERYREFKYWGFIDGIFAGIPTGSQLSIEECKLLSQQFTGLYDRRGNEIYEGDVVELDVTFDNKFLPFGQDDDEPAETHHEGTFKVYWNTENACFDLDKITGTQSGWFLQESNSELEVIGNIHENPELLK